MSGDSADHVAVARREIVDLVYRCCRVRRIDAGAAHRCGENVAHGEVHRGGSVAAFLAAFQEGNEAAIAAFVGAASQVELAEAEGDAQVFLEQPVATAAISATLWEAASRSFLVTIADQADAAEVVGVLTFERTALSGERKEQAAHREAAAGINGVSIARSHLEALEHHASAYLVAESDVDAAVGDT